MSVLGRLILLTVASFAVLGSLPAWGEERKRSLDEIIAALEKKVARLEALARKQGAKTGMPGRLVPAESLYDRLEVITRQIINGRGTLRQLLTEKDWNDAIEKINKQAREGKGLKRAQVGKREQVDPESKVKEAGKAFARFVGENTKTSDRAVAHLKQVSERLSDLAQCLGKRKGGGEDDELEGLLEGARNALEEARRALDSARKALNIRSAIRVSERDLLDAYENNVVEADMRFKGKRLIVEGRVTRVEPDSGDSYLIVTIDENWFNQDDDPPRLVVCMFPKTMAKDLVRIRPCASVAVRGVCEGKEASQGGKSAKGLVVKLGFCDFIEMDE